MHGSLATKLRVLRAERGLTVRQVAELSGVAKETISQVERGERHPYDRTLAKLAHAYDVPVEELLEEPEVALAGSPKAPAPPETGDVHHMRRPGDSLDVSDKVAEVRIEKARQILRDLDAAKITVVDADKAFEQTYRPAM
jgi:transcriptional regulator with XRE-family HTH domain